MYTYIYIYIYIHLYTYIHMYYVYICVIMSPALYIHLSKAVSGPPDPWNQSCAWNLCDPNRVYGQSPYKHSGFQRVWLKHNLNIKGWNSHVHRGFPGKFESSNLSRDNVSGEIGRSPRSGPCECRNLLATSPASSCSREEAALRARGQSPHLGFPRRDLPGAWVSGGCPRL